MTGNRLRLGRVAVGLGLILIIGLLAGPPTRPSPLD